MHAVHSFMGAGVSYNIIDFNIKMISLDGSSLKNSNLCKFQTHDQPKNGLLSPEIYS